MNLLSKVIEQFKSKDWANVKYNYTKLDIDKAKLEYLESPNRTTTEYIKFLRPQSDIFPVKTDNNLIWLCSYLYLFDKASLLTELHDLVDENKDLILKKEVFIDNDKHLWWTINESSFLNVRYQEHNAHVPGAEFWYGKEAKEKLSLYINREDSDALVMAIAHFIYTNVKEGKL